MPRDTVSNRRRFLKTTATTATAGLLAGCAGETGGSADATGTTTATTTAQASQGLSKKSLSILTTYYPGASYSGVVAAKYFDYFKEVGFEDVTVEWSFSLNPLQVINSQKFDIVLSNHINTINGKSMGVPIETVTTTQGNTVQSYAVKSDSGISSIGDFAGKVVGIQNTSDVKAFQNEIFQKELTKQQRENIKKVFIGYDIKNLLTGKVDSMTIFPTNPDIISLERTGSADLSFLPMMDYLKVPGNAALTSTQFATEHEDALIEFTRAHVKGLEDSLNPDKFDKLAGACVKSLKSHGVADVFLEGADPNAVEKEALKRFTDFRKIPEWDQHGVGWNPSERIATAQKLLINTGFIDKAAATPVKKLANNKYVNEVHDDNGNLIWPGE